MNFDLLIRLLALLIEIAVAVLLVPWLRGKLKEQKFEEVQEWVCAAVAAAEKIFWREGEGVDKKAWVLEFLANKGIQIDAESLDVLIEAAVCKLPEYFDVSAELTETEGGAADESEADDENSE